ncbi:16501_t:CDS:1, partial [Funneliformis geosporum]
EDLCWHIIYLHTEGLPTTEIANTLHMSKGVVNKIKSDITVRYMLKILLKVFLVEERYLAEKI